MTADNVAKFSVVPQFQRDQSGKFLKGSGGRPVGARAKASRELLAQVKALGPNAVQKLSEAVDKGERWAIELVFSHSLPRERVVEFEGTAPDDVTEALKAGDISIAEAKDLATTFKSLAEVGDGADLRAKLDELEKRFGEVSR